MRSLAAIALLCFFPLISVADEKLIVMTDIWPPYVTQQGTELSGLSTKIVKRVLANSSIPHEIRVVPWARAYEAALKQKNTLIYTLVRTEDREKQFKWVGELHPSDPTHIFGIGVQNHTPTTLADAKERMVAAVRHSMSAEALINAGFKVGKNIFLTDDDAAAIRLAEMGRTDFVATSQNTINAYVNRHPFLENTVVRGPNLLDSRLYLAASNMTDSRIVEKLRAAFKIVKEQSPTE